MQILSLFDGIGTAGLAIKNVFGHDFGYQASEINPKLVKFTSDKFSNIHHLGDIKDIIPYNIVKPGILICGSPCQGLSNAGKRKGLLDNRSSLFWDAVRIRNTVKPEYWLFENVVSSDANIKIMSDALGVAPIIINSRHFTYQDRLRCYWCNWDVRQPTTELKQFSHTIVRRKAFGYWRKTSYMPTLTSNIATCDWQMKNDFQPDWFDIEWETYDIAQGFEPGYTEPLPYSTRRQALANSFTLPVIEYLLTHLL